MADYLKIPEVARRLDVSEPTVRRMVKSGKLPSVFIGGAYRVSETDLEQFLENAKVDPGKAPAPSSQDKLFNNGLEDERRAPSLRSWIDFVGRLAVRWEKEIEDREREWQAAKPAIRKHVKRLPNLNWANEIRMTAGDIVDITAEELERGVLVYSTEEALELFSALQRLDKAIDRTDPWFRTDAEDAPKVAQVYDFRKALKRMESKIGARAS